MPDWLVARDRRLATRPLERAVEFLASIGPIISTKMTGK